MLSELFILLPLTFVAAMLNATVGGGGLVLIPGMFTLYPAAVPASLFASEKCAGVAGLAAAAIQFSRRIRRRASGGAGDRHAAEYLDQAIWVVC